MHLSQPVAARFFLATLRARSTCMRSYCCRRAAFPTLGKTFAVMLGVTGTPADSFERRRCNWQVWYPPGQYVVRCVQFLCIDGPESPESRPSAPEGKEKLVRDWRRRLRIIEERKLIKAASWSEKFIRRIGDFPYRKVRPSLPKGSVRAAIVMLRRKRRRQRQRQRQALPAMHGL